MSFDLNLDNYKYEDLAKLFQMKGHSTNQIKAIRTKCDMVKRNYPEDIYTFYYKSGKALECILQLIEQNQLLPNDVCLNDYLEKIKGVRSFETYDTSNLIAVIHFSLFTEFITFVMVGVGFSDKVKFIKTKKVICIIFI